MTVLAGLMKTPYLPIIVVVSALSLASANAMPDLGREAGKFIQNEEPAPNGVRTFEPVKAENPQSDLSILLPWHRGNSQPSLSILLPWHGGKPQPRLSILLPWHGGKSQQRLSALLPWRQASWTNSAA